VPGEGWRLLRSWLEQVDEDVEQRVRLIDRVLTANLPPGVRMLHLLRRLDPTIPPVYRGGSVLPAHVAQIAAAASAGPGQPANVVRDLWDHHLLGPLSHFAGGAALVGIDRAWRNSMTQLEAVHGATAMPPPGTHALARSAVVHRAVLLRVAADRGLATVLTQQAVDALAAMPGRPPRFGTVQRYRVRRWRSRS